MIDALTPATAVLILLGIFDPACLPGSNRSSPHSTVDICASLSPDDDRDGVGDRDDACPGTPAGYPVDAIGCALDTDGDGVSDGADRCPATRPTRLGDEPSVDAAGCSAQDRKHPIDFPYGVEVG